MPKIVNEALNTCNTAPTAGESVPPKYRAHLPRPWTGQTELVHELRTHDVKRADRDAKIMIGRFSEALKIARTAVRNQRREVDWIGPFFNELLRHAPADRIPTLTVPQAMKAIRMPVPAPEQPEMVMIDVTPSAATFAAMIAKWERENTPRPSSVNGTKTAFAKLQRHLGHDNGATVTFDDLLDSRSR